MVNDAWAVCANYVVTFGLPEPEVHQGPSTGPLRTRTPVKEKGLSLKIQGYFCIHQRIHLLSKILCGHQSMIYIFIIYFCVCVCILVRVCVCPCACVRWAAVDPSPEELLRQLQEERTCKVCMDKPVSIVFIPCGHLVVCSDCATSLRHCPICRASIRGSVRAFMSWAVALPWRAPC